MSTLHEVSTAKNGTPFAAIGPVETKQRPAKIAKNGKLCSTIILKSAGNEVFLTLWEDAAKWKVPDGTHILRGKFVRTSYNESASLKCDEFVPPEGSEEVKESEVVQSAAHPKMKTCLDAGLRAADYMLKRERPELAAAAFSFAAKACQQGVALE